MYPSRLTRISYQVGRPWMLDGKTFLPETGIPIGRMCVESFQGARERALMKNIAYAGALAALLNMDMEVIRGMVEEKFSAKPALVESNRRALALGYDYVVEQFEHPLPLRLEPMDATADSVIMDGNTAAAIGCL